MNDLQDLWQQEEKTNAVLDELLRSHSFEHGTQSSPLLKLKKNLFIHLIYAIVITLGYGVLIFFFPYWQTQACLLLLIGFNLWAMANAFQLYISIAPDMSQNNVLDYLKSHYNAFKEWQKQSLRVALWVYPFAAAGGFMLGGIMGSGKTPEEFLMNYKIQIALAITIVVLVPLSYLLAKWMTRVAFGVYVDQLKERIGELEREG